MNDRPHQPLRSSELPSSEQPLTAELQAALTRRLNLCGPGVLDPDATITMWSAACNNEEDSK